MYQCAVPTQAKIVQYITQVALFFTHHRFLNEMRCVVFRHAAVVDGNLNQCPVNVFGHVLLITANVEVSATLKPLPNFQPRAP